MTPPRCRPDGFATRRLARRAAWLRADAGKHVVPVECDQCGKWHLATV